MTLKKFSDFAKNNIIEGVKKHIDDILNKEIIITNAKISKSKYSKNESGKYLTLQYKNEENGKAYIIFTGSDVLISQIEEYKEQIPFQTKIIKINRYYTFS